MLLAIVVAGRLESSLRAATFTDFDNVFAGTPYTLLQNNVAPGPAIVAGGPTGAFLRLTTTNNSLNNSVDFKLSDAGAYNQVVADFDFRITPGPNGASDGFGFALLNTANFGAEGGVELPGNVLYEEPNLTNSLGVGFDIFNNGAEINGNHLSVHFNGAQLAEFDAGTVTLASGQWIHAKITMRPGGGFSDVSVVLTPAGGQAVTVVNNFVVNGFLPYEGRVHFGARTGPALSASHDLDNINVQFANPAAGPAAQFIWGFTNFTTVEGSPLYLHVQRINNAAGAASVQVAISNGTAVAGTDFTVPNATLNFADGESIHYFTLPTTKNGAVNANKTFVAVLTNAVGATIGAQSNALATIVDVDNPAVVGQWSGVSNFPANPYPLVSIHLNLLPNGKILFWDRHGTNFGGTDGDQYLWDVNANTFIKTPTNSYDLFCAGHALMPDGRLFVVGGHITDGDGENKASIYDPASNTWTRITDMNLGRWYPTVTTLATGELLVEAGTYGINGVNVNKTNQVWNPITGTWRYLTTAGAQNQGFPVWANYYPYMMQAPNGMVFCAGPQQMARYLDPTGTGNWIDVAASSLTYRDYGTACMYDDGKVFLTGGNPQEPFFEGPFQYFPSRIAEVINLNDAQPAWRRVAPMNIGRRFGTATLLPDGKVLVTGGSSAPGFNNVAGAAFFAELWDPVTEQWTVLAAQARPRGYHCNSLLLPDGRVVSTGGGHPDPVDGTAEPNAEFFSPPYLFKGARPTISAAPNTTTYGQTFSVQTPDAANVANVNWIRIGDITHNFNQNQHINRLAFTKTATGVQVTAPASSVLAPPGHYLLFLLNSNGVPSIAKIIQIGTGITGMATVGGDRQVTFTTIAGSRYQLERTDGLVSVNNVWTVVGTAVTATGATTTVTDVGGAAQTKRFYRVHQVP
ncbi:MAG: DUF1929 domain-containing protein [Verrucomicrobia bacterium]|nr:DUF1929 domain-containing protein [Verrucomicrobiota bacterium]